MKNRAIVLLAFGFTFLFSNPSLAQLEGLNNLEVKNFNFNYQGSTGDTEADQVNVGLKSLDINWESPLVHLEKQGNSFSVKHEGLSLNFENTEGGIFDSMEKVNIDNASLLYIPFKKLQLEWNQAEIGLGDGVQRLGRLELNCQVWHGQKQLASSFMKPCFDVGRLSIPEIILAEVSQNTLGKIVNTTNEKIFGGPKVIRDLKLHILRGKFYLSAVTKWLFKLKFKMEGTSSYDELTGLAVFHVKKAKIGFFSVRSILLKEIKKAKIKNVKVEGKNIIMQF